MRSLCLAALVLFAILVQTAGAKTLVFCSEGNPESLNPQQVTTTTGMNAARPIFDNLVEFEPGTTILVPGLAQSWEISSDGTEYTFHLRRGVAFHSNSLFKPTRDFDADDVLFSFMRQWKEDNPYHRISGASYDYFKDMGMPNLLQSVDRLDDYTVRIRLSRPEAPFLADLAMPFFAISSAEYANMLLKAGTPERFDQEPIGTGPFAFVSFRKDMAIRYRAFAEHWRGAQPIDQLVYAITPNSAVRLTKLKAGECHVMAFPNPADLARIAADPSLQLLSQEGLNVGYLAMNTRRPPFDDVRVRRAMNLAIDKEAIIQAIYQGAGTVARNAIPPTLWSYDASVRDYPYDPDEAQRLLTEAGHPQGFEAELWYMPVSRPYNPDGKRMAEMIAADLGKVGVHVRLVTDEWGPYRAALQAGKADLALYGWTGDNGDPDNFLDVLLGCTAARPGGNNVAKWCNSEYDTLVTKAKAVSDRDARSVLYRQAQQIFKREAPWVPIAHSVVFMAIRKGVTGFKMDPLGRQAFMGVDLAP